MQSDYKANTFEPGPFLAIERLEQFIPGEALLEILTVAQRETEEITGTLKMSVERLDWQEIEDQIHKIKGVLSAVCTQPVIETASRLNLAALSKDIETVEAEFRRLEFVASQLHHEVQLLASRLNERHDVT